jgi:hypothetical protein
MSLSDHEHLTGQLKGSLVMINKTASCRKNRVTNVRREWWLRKGGAACPCRLELKDTR